LNNIKTIIIKGGQNIKNLSLFNLGFRPFFLGAAIFSVISITLWSAIYDLQLSIPINNISIFQWHAHEMIYGYGMAVIAGFLLTAVRNWTGVQTLHGTPLLILFSLWMMARILFLFGTTYLLIAALFDIAFALYLGIAIAYPIIKVKQWRQLAILSKIILLITFNICFYLGAFAYLENGAYLGIYGGLYLIIGLVMTIGRRVIPMFIERGVGYEVRLFNSRWIDISNIVMFLVFFVSELFLSSHALTALMACGLFITNSVRLYGWHTPGIWRVPLLWSLYISLLFIDIGFLLFTMTYFMDISKYIAIHALAFGGIGIVTLSMMSRVSLGHTGRNINAVSNLIKLALISLTIGAIVRVGFPLLTSDNYLLGIVISQLLWITSFLLFTLVYAPILTQARADGQPG
jgi:uncharacterized protein involved in response to NO